MTAGNSFLECTAGGELSAAPGICITDTGCSASVTKTSVNRIGAFGAAKPSQTSCPETMRTMDTCWAMCSSGRVIGHILCMNGALNDFSYCVDEASLSAEAQVKNVMKVVATMKVTIQGALSVTSLVSSLSVALGVAASYIFAEWRVDGGRRLQAGSSIGQDYIVKYEVVVQEDPGVPSVAQIVARASEVTRGESATANLFVSQMSAVGLSVTKIQHVHAPSVFTSVVLVGKDGQTIKLKTPISDGPAPVPTLSSLRGESDSGAAWVGGIVGGVLGLTLILACVYYMMVVRKSPS